mgnify:CR=1 FL=1
MTGPAAGLWVALAACAAAAQPLALPSGLQVEPIEVILDAEMHLARFRFLAPAIAARGFDMESLGPDFDWLCAQVAAPGLRAERPDWDEVVISLSSAVIPFGTADPEVAQAFEGYRIDSDGGCIWLQF